MCIIVDANSVHHLANRTEAGKPVLSWLLRAAKAGLVVGGKNYEEIAISSFRSTLAVLQQAGRLHRISHEKINAIIEQRLGGTCKSNDAHVVALALASRCRLVFSGDIALHSDLKANSRPGDRISIYQNHSHSHLLVPCKCLEASR